MCACTFSQFHCFVCQRDCALLYMRVRICLFTCMLMVYFCSCNCNFKHVGGVPSHVQACNHWNALASVLIGACSGRSSLHRCAVSSGDVSAHMLTKTQGWHALLPSSFLLRFALSSNTFLAYLWMQEFQIRILDVDKFNSSKSLHVCFLSHCSLRYGCGICAVSSHVP